MFGFNRHEHHEEEEESVENCEILQHRIHVHAGNCSVEGRLEVPFVIPQGRRIVNFDKAAKIVSNQGENNKVDVEWGKREDAQGYDVLLVGSRGEPSGSLEAHVNIYLAMLEKNLRPGDQSYRQLGQERQQAAEQVFEPKPILSPTPAAELKVSQGNNRKTLEAALRALQAQYGDSPQSALKGMIAEAKTTLETLQTQRQTTQIPALRQKLQRQQSQAESELTQYEKDLAEWVRLEQALSAFTLSPPTQAGASVHVVQGNLRMEQAELETEGGAVDIASPARSTTSSGVEQFLCQGASHVDLQQDNIHMQGVKIKAKGNIRIGNIS